MKKAIFSGHFFMLQNYVPHFNFFVMIRTVDTARSLIAIILLSSISLQRSDLYSHMQSQMGIFDPDIFFKIMFSFVAHHVPQGWSMIRSDTFNITCSVGEYFKLKISTAFLN